MEITAKLQKPIREAKYLTAENCHRYRVILRYFYIQYEKIKYWLYREDIFEALKTAPELLGYTQEMCWQDVDMLAEWGNLIPMQDTSRVKTVEEFKNKKFRYQLSEYAVEIERLTIKLENIHIEGASLEPTLFERIKDAVCSMDTLNISDIKVIGLWWRDLNTDFKRLNQNYQDYMRSFHSFKVEEMMKSREFLVYKDRIVEYLREFIKELQKNVYVIEERLKNLGRKRIDKILEAVVNYEYSVPRMEYEVEEKDIKDNTLGRWDSFYEWFSGKDGHSESEVLKVLEMTNEIIRKITRYASQIAESRSSGANRKEEYIKLCEIFLKCSDIDEAHKISATVFGVSNTKHIKVSKERKTDSINSSVYDEDPEEIILKARIRGSSIKTVRTPIKDKTAKKEKMYKEYIKKLAEEKKVIEAFEKDSIIDIENLGVITKHTRYTLLNWIGKASINKSGTGKTEFGRIFRLEVPNIEKRCILECEDGNMEMPAYRFVFEK